MLTIGTLHLPSVMFCLSGWAGFYFLLCKIMPEYKPEWHCRSVTAFHAIIITILSGWSAFVQGPWPFTDAGGPNTPLQVMVTTVCLGYFIFDFTWCLYYQTEGRYPLLHHSLNHCETWTSSIARTAAVMSSSIFISNCVFAGPPMLLHHSLSLLGLTWTLASGKYGTEMMATLCGSEVTNPLLQLRWFLRETGHHLTALGEIVDLLFMISFFTLRIGIGSLLLYCYFQQPTDFMGRLGATLIYLIGWMFWISIFRYAVRKYSKIYKKYYESKRDGASTLNSEQHTSNTIPSQTDICTPNSEKIAETLICENSKNLANILDGSTSEREITQNYLRHDGISSSENETTLCDLNGISKCESDVFSSDRLSAVSKHESNLFTTDVLLSSSSLVSNGALHKTNGNETINGYTISCMNNSVGKGIHTAAKKNL